MLNNKSFILLSLTTLVAASSAKSLSDFDIDLESHIVNGETSQRGQFPFYALVRVILTDGRVGACGASLINNQWLVTAAHCVSIRGVTIDRFEIHMGALHLTELSEDGRVIVTTRTAFPHPEFTLYRIQNDIALLRLDEPVEFSDTIKPVRLTTGGYTLRPGISVATIGFGRTLTSGYQLASILQWGVLQYITRQQCSGTFPGLAYRPDIICAQGMRYESPCNGDNGGPLVVSEYGEPTLVGAASFQHGAGCYHGHPAGFVNIAHFLTWIRQTIYSAPQ